MHRILACIPLLFLAACTANHAADRARLIQTVEAGSAAAQARDLEALMASYADDAVVLPPDAPPLRGKAAIRPYIAEVLAIPGFSIRWTVTDAELSKAGDMGYVTEDTFATFPDGSGGTASSQGKSVTVWRRAPDGSWLCVVDIWNDPPTE